MSNEIEEIFQQLVDRGVTPEQAAEGIRIIRIDLARYKRGADAATAGKPPTEANSEYQRGYTEALARVRP
jgi:hypothetical protein